MYTYYITTLVDKHNGAILAHYNVTQIQSERRNAQDIVHLTKKSNTNVHINQTHVELTIQMVISDSCATYMLRVTHRASRESQTTCSTQGVINNMILHRYS